MPIIFLLTINDDVTRAGQFLYRPALIINEPSYFWLNQLWSILRLANETYVSLDSLNLLAHQSIERNMQKPFIADKTFKGQDFSETRLPQGEYENCRFEGCNFSRGFLDNQNFMECQFVDCNLSNANIVNTTFKEVEFDLCKMMGLRFETCNTFLIEFLFSGCDLSYSSFYEMTLNKQKFLNCNLTSTDFSSAQLKEVSFQNCNMLNAVFNNTDLEKSDFTSAKNYSIDPERNKLKKAKFSLNEIKGLLHKYEITIV